NTQGNTVTVLLGNGDGSFGRRLDYGSGLNARALAIGDLNGDGKPELVVANQGAATVAVLLNGQAIAAIDPGRPPTSFEFAPPQPNPFMVRATFEIGVPTAAFVRLEIYDLQGRRVRVLQDGWLEPGRHMRSWNGITASGTVARAGVYVIRLSAPGVELTRKAVLVR